MKIPEERKRQIIAFVAIVALLLVVNQVSNNKLLNSLDGKSQLAALSTVGGINSSKEKSKFPEVALLKRMKGSEALEKIKDKLPEMAAWYHMSPRALEKILAKDSNVWLDEKGRIYYVDEGLVPEQGAISSESSTFVDGNNFPLDQTFKLHSRPGAKKTIYIDFDGGSVSNTSWNSYVSGQALNFPAYDIDGNPASFSSAELSNIQQIWQRVSEDYAPFDIDVTTEFVSWDLITRSSTNDQYYGTWVAVDDRCTDWFTSDCGGVAYIGAFDDTSDTYKPAWVFRSPLGNGNPKYVAEAISHEVGHNLGLNHDGTASVGYYTGQGDWAPIMGVGYYKNITQFSKGEYSGANNTEDDFARMQLTGATLLDDYGDSISQSSVLSIVNENISGGGVINSRTDKDVFSFTTTGGNVNLIFNPGLANSANLDIAVELLDGSGSRIISSDPIGLASSISTTLAAGTYYVAIDGVGFGDSMATGYTDYGSVGQYKISGSVPSTGNISPPTAAASASPLTGAPPLEIVFSSVGSFDQDGSIVKYIWSFGDGTTSVEPDPIKTYSNPGSYEAVLTVEDNMGLTDTASVNITVSNETPVANMTTSVTGGTVPLTVDFNASNSSDADGTIVDYVWDFGDGFTARGSATASHTYNTDGTYNSSVTVYDNFGKTATKYVSIKVDPSSNTLSAPSGVSAVFLNGTASILWGYSGDKQSGFYIERGTRAKGKYSWERIGAVSATDRKYEDVNVTKDYYYRVQAFNSESTSEYTIPVFVRVQTDTTSGKPPKGR